MKVQPHRIGTAEAERKYPTAVRHIRHVAAEAAYLNACLDALNGATAPADKILLLEDAKAAVAALKASPAVRVGFGFITGLDTVESDLAGLEADYRARGLYVSAAVASLLGERR